VSGVRDIASGVWTWTWFSEPHGYDFNGYLVLDPGGNVCVDPVAPAPDDLAALVRAGVRAIVLTNRNHVRAAPAVRAATGARTLIHPADAAHARAQGAEIDGDLVPGECVGPFTVIGVPGKSPGEVALHWSARRILVVGDAVVGKPPGRCALLPDRVMDDPARLRESVRGLLALDFDTLLVGDGTPILHDARARLGELCGSLA
jgi:glyoxylase-like metal-dependent hydrolase (beta-lactamase superfamily II)